MIRRPPRSTRTDTLFPTRRSSDLRRMKARPPMQDYADIREEVAKLCAAFPGPYWQAKDRARAYPSEFVAALGKAGYLAALIPEEYGRSEEHTSELQSLMRISYDVFCLKQKTRHQIIHIIS